MTFRVESRIGIQAPSDRIWALIEDLPYWDRWNPVETGVSGTIAFGGQLTLTETIEGLPTRKVQARVAEWQPLAQLILAEKRGWSFQSLRYFEIEELEPGSCIFATGTVFSGFRGEGFHDKHRPRIKAAYARLVEAVKAHAES